MYQQYVFQQSNPIFDHKFNPQISNQSQFYLEELKQIQTQSEMIQKILSLKLPKQKQNKNFILNIDSAQSIQDEFQIPSMKKSQSMVSIYSLSYDLNNFSFCYQDRLKFGSQGSKFLNQVKQKCSNDVYKYFSKLVQQNRKNQKKKDFKTKQNQEILKLNEQNLILSHQKQVLKQQINQLQQKVQKLKKQLEKSSLKQNFILNLQKKLLKKQQSILYQRKICANMSKEIKQEMNKLQQIYQKIQLQKSSSQQEKNCIQVDNFHQRQNDPCEINQNEAQYQQKSNKCSQSVQSKSTIDGGNIQKPEIVELWNLLNKIEKINAEITN